MAGLQKALLNRPELFVSTTTEKLHEPVRLAAATNPVLAHIWQQALEDQGIQCQVLGDYLDAGIGDISGISAEVWVDSADQVRAETILQELHDRAKESDEDGDEEDEADEGGIEEIDEDEIEDVSEITK